MTKPVICACSRRNGNPASRQSGVTLIELLLVVMVIGVLAAIAYPSYQRYVERANRSAVQGQMMDLARALEVYRSQNFTYTGAAVTLTPELANNQYYTATLPTLTGSTYVILARPRNVMAGTGALALDNRGRTCWNSASDTACDLNSPPATWSGN